MAGPPKVDKSFQALVDKYLGQANGSNVKHPIGVPDDYTTRAADYTGKGPKGRSGRYREFDRPPTYFTGDESKYASRSPEEIQQLQMALVDAGLLDPDTVAWGRPDAYTTAAYRQLLTESNQSGQTWQNTLGARLDAAAQGLIHRKGAANKQPVPRTITLTNEKDIKAQADVTAPDLLGQQLQPDEMMPFVAKYHELETNAQNQEFDQQYGKDGLGGTGGTTVKQPQLDSFMADEIKNKYQNEVGGNTLGQNGLMFLKMLSGGSTGLAGYQS